jgi:lipoprotein-anchoring transpeptidase ErfK/SrfK
MGNDRATHGCIGLPREFAALLYDQVGLGDQVIVWSGRAEG